MADDKSGFLKGVPLHPFPLHYSSVKIYRHDVLGRGSYGYVCRAKADQLDCAAKMINPIFFEIGGSPGREELENPERAITGRFLAECELLRSLPSHPNIVQFIGVCRIAEEMRGGEYGPVLLTELMSTTLWDYVSSKSRDFTPKSRDRAPIRPDYIPRTTQVKIMKDIAVALSFLHDRDILHRDLSSKNVLMKDDAPKISDLGMAKLRDVTKSLTTCPGTPIFMAPEALLNNPAYSTKLDIFSWGVISLQVMSGQEPDPLSPFVAEVDSDGRELRIPVTETERWKDTIKAIDPGHPLLSLALEAIKNRPENRPTANDLCSKIENILHNLTRRQENFYKEERGEKKEKRKEEGDVKSVGPCLLYSAASSSSDRINSDIETSPPSTPSTLSPPLSSPDSRSILFSDTFNWTSIKDSAPCHFMGGSVTTLAGKVYASRPHSSIIHEYDPETLTWSVLPSLCPVENFTLVSHIGKVLAVGGVKGVAYSGEHRKVSNAVYACDVLSSNLSWTDTLISSMYYPRSLPAALSSKTYLVVAGGLDDKSSPVSHVEIHNGSYWYTSSSLPVPFSTLSAVIDNNDIIYITGEVKGKGSVLCSAALSRLYGQSSSYYKPLFSVWQKMESPLSGGSLVVVRGDLFLIGGYDASHSNGYPQYNGNIYQLKRKEKKFSIEEGPEARGRCLATQLPSNRGVMVFGGNGQKSINIGQR
ncbi:PREDICTED: uncharacterized protein LOC109580292 [Amphimedon queenslandica]|uniref:Protein kinase domain-containing protein n=1 Tax=Amphimedon queenslandica TaxID=400682 RepID=A0A1X7VIR8_AMPQE|nr:PREDICTED: uncharacterized protein LOC109580292 [Amphimedon queenslandica]|eukprot:XP_019848887.1 PREDICTED: uncharacterized protein LOC109580292 [Amphimedon queenslandica]